MNVTLTGEMARFVEAKLRSGRYASPTEVLSDALRLLEEQDSQGAADLRRLREAWAVGIEDGDFQPLDLDAVKTTARERMHAGG